MSEVRPYSDEFLAAYLDEHLLYEIQMFVGSKKFLTNDAHRIQCKAEDEQFVINMLIEIFAIHLRNFIGFFYGDLGKIREDDVFAVDYCEGSAWQTQRPPMSDSLRLAGNRANKQIAHLTSRRYVGDHPEKRWYVPALNEEMRAIFLKFLAVADIGKLGPIARDERNWYLPDDS